MTVIGLALGAGYFFVGGAMVAIALAVLLGLLNLESRLARSHSAMLIVETDRERPPDAELRQRIVDAGYKIVLFAATLRDTRQLRVSLNWQAVEGAVSMPSLVRELHEMDGVYAVVWNPQDADDHD